MPSKEANNDKQYWHGHKKPEAGSFAVCVSGGLRSFIALAWTWEQRLIAPTVASGSTVDFFFHVWSDGSEIAQRGESSMRALPGVVSAVVEPISDWERITVSFFPFLQNRTNPFGDVPGLPDMVKRFRSAWRKVHLAFYLAIAHEARTAPYSAYVRSRPDLVYTMSVDLNVLHSNLIHHDATVRAGYEYLAIPECHTNCMMGITDQWAIGTKKAMAKYSALPGEKDREAEYYVNEQLIRNGFFHVALGTYACQHSLRDVRSVKKEVPLYTIAGVVKLLRASNPAAVLREGVICAHYCERSWAERFVELQGDASRRGLVMRTSSSHNMVELPDYCLPALGNNSQFAPAVLYPRHQENAKGFLCFHVNDGTQPPHELSSNDTLLQLLISNGQEQHIEAKISPGRNAFENILCHQSIVDALTVSCTSHGKCPQGTYCSVKTSLCAPCFQCCWECVVGDCHCGDRCKCPKNARKVAKGVEL